MTKVKTYSYIDPEGFTHTVSFVRSYDDKYSNTIIKMRCLENGTYVPYANLTVSIDPNENETYGCVDANNLGDSIVDWLLENNIIEPRGDIGKKVLHSEQGWLYYPLVQFKQDFLNETPLE